jgi:hypothetical protein
MCVRHADDLGLKFLTRQCDWLFHGSHDRHVRATVPRQGECFKALVTGAGTGSLAFVYKFRPSPEEVFIHTRLALALNNSSPLNNNSKCSDEALDIPLYYDLLHIQSPLAGLPLATPLWPKVYFQHHPRAGNCQV